MTGLAYTPGTKVEWGSGVKVDRLHKGCMNREISVGTKLQYTLASYPLNRTKIGT